MSSTQKEGKYDYSKVEAQQNPRNSWIYFGIHPKNGRIRVDTERFKKIMEQDGTDEFLRDEMFNQRDSFYFIPSKIHRYDYQVNFVLDSIRAIANDWFNEYLPIFKEIKTPKDAYESTRNQILMGASGYYDVEDIEFDSFRESLRRSTKYQQVVCDLKASFIIRICNEIDRMTVKMMKNLGYKKNDFSVKDFIDFSQQRFKNIDFNDIEKYSSYELLHLIKNFLSHNTCKSYRTLKNKYPKYVRSISDGNDKVDYESGMPASEWITVKDSYIDNVFDETSIFFKDYCKKILGENVDDADWDYDDYFKYVFGEVKDLNEYFGV